MAKYKLPRNKIDSGDNIRIRNILDSEDFNLEQKIGEPLTGRKKVIILTCPLKLLYVKTPSR